MRANGGTPGEVENNEHVNLGRKFGGGGSGGRISIGYTRMSGNLTVVAAGAALPEGCLGHRADAGESLRAQDCFALLEACLDDGDASCPLLQAL